MKRLLRYLRAKQFDRDLKAEIQAHLEEKIREADVLWCDPKIDEFIEDGLAPDAARTKALRQFGNRTQVREDSRSQWV